MRFPSNFDAKQASPYTPCQLKQHEDVRGNLGQKLNNDICLLLYIVV
jgi:hypothetical protein